MRKPRNQQGFSIMELMVTVAIVAILTTLAVPAYSNFVARSVRTQAKSTLMLVADRQEHFFLDNKAYAADLTNLGFKSNPMYVDRNGTQVPATSGDRIYKILLANLTATTFTVQAVPLQHQASADTACGTLSLTHAGQRGKSGAGSNCW
ncbi:MAG: type IV pilin protein [Gammaproteobacteria bacterium]|nr:type IV pilin protein [Gammaproteobacteria bacterium]MDH3768248.1 type IV pilin protein [Gammaproteobacteria bacterium]